MLKWMCMNDGRYFMMKWNISTYNKQSYHIWSRGFYIDYIGCNDKMAQAVGQIWQHDGCGNDEDGQIINLIHNILFMWWWDMVMAMTIMARGQHSIE